MRQCMKKILLAAAAWAVTLLALAVVLPAEMIRSAAGYIRRKRKS